MCVMCDTFACICIYLLVLGRWAILLESEFKTQKAYWLFFLFPRTSYQPHENILLISQMIQFINIFKTACKRYTWSDQWKKEVISEFSNEWKIDVRFQWKWSGLMASGNFYSVQKLLWFSLNMRMNLCFIFSSISLIGAAGTSKSFKNWRVGSEENRLNL